MKKTMAFPFALITIFAILLFGTIYISNYFSNHNDIYDLYRGVSYSKIDGPKSYTQLILNSDGTIEVKFRSHWFKKITQYSAKEVNNYPKSYLKVNFISIDVTKGCRTYSKILHRDKHYKTHKDLFDWADKDVKYQLKRFKHLIKFKKKLKE